MRQNATSHSVMSHCVVSPMSYTIRLDFFSINGKHSSDRRVRRTRAAESPHDRAQNRHRRDRGRLCSAPRPPHLYRCRGTGDVGPPPVATRRDTTTAGGETAGFAPGADLDIARKPAPRTRARRPGGSPGGDGGAGAARGAAPPQRSHQRHYPAATPADPTDRTATAATDDPLRHPITHPCRSHPPQHRRSLGRAVTSLFSLAVLGCPLTQVGGGLLLIKLKSSSIPNLRV